MRKPPCNPLPPQAADKLATFEQQAREAEVLAFDCVSQIGAMQKQSRAVRDYDEAAALQSSIDKMTATRQAHQSRVRELAALVAALGHWVSALPADTALETIRPPAVRLLKGETLVEAVDRIRADLAEAQAELRAVLSASPSKADLRKTLERRVAAMAARGKPKLAVKAGELSIDFADPGSFTVGASAQHLAATLAWLDPLAMFKKLEAELDAVTVRGLTLSAAQKADRSQQLTDAIERLELVEESLISKAEAAKQTIARRPNASPAAVLGVRLKDRVDRAAAAA
ncbi:MAG: hypothetical protein Q8M26_07285 [Pseudolabrys sp.]|nr:hypothetical protein [Pseudolabrys sp.]